MAENITPRKQLVAVEAVSKLCSEHGFHTKEDVGQCDIQDGKCSATVSMETNIGDEQQWAEKCLRNLKNDGMEVKFVTTDEGGTSISAHQLDTRHLGANQ